jgi:thiamine-monophosphate kinase
LNLASIGEFGFIRRIAAKCGSDPALLLGIGDDAAAFKVSAGKVLLATSDLLADGVHFDLAWSDPFSLGQKSLSVNLSDIASMGGVPRFVLLALAIPKDLPVEFLDSFMSGFLQQAEKFGVTLIGGDTSASRGGLFITVTLLGEQFSDKIVSRSGAAPGDLICVSGTVGDASLGLNLLRKGIRAGWAVGRHLEPTPRVSLGIGLAEAGIPSAMIDISDGLLADLGHILESSAAGAQLDLEALPLSEEFKGALADSGGELINLSLSGGEDYELLFTLPESRLGEARQLAEATGTAVTVVGSITAAQGIVIKNDAGVFLGKAGGHDHFAG